jgi:hypothetical protein
MATVEPVRAMPSALHYGQETFDRDFDTIHESSVEADMYFLQRDELWETEKPYGMRYYAEGIAQSNVRREKHRIVLKDIRQLTIAPSVDVQGFSVMALDSRMAYEDFNDYSKIKLIYHQDIVAALKKTLGAKHVFVMDNAVCACYLQLSALRHLILKTGSSQRSKLPNFPREELRMGSAHGYVTHWYEAPWYQSLESHSYKPDFTRDEAVRMLTTLYGKRAPEVLSARWQVIKFVTLSLVM